MIYNEIILLSPLPERHQHLIMSVLVLLILLILTLTNVLMTQVTGYLMMKILFVMCCHLKTGRLKQNDNEIPCCRRQKRGSESGNLSYCPAPSAMQTREGWLRGLNILGNFSSWRSLPWWIKIVIMRWYGLNLHQRGLFRTHNIFIIPHCSTHANILCPPRAGFFLPQRHSNKRDCNQSNKNTRNIFINDNDN